jgi:DNA-binding MarR family transcriptional regulator
VKREKSINYRVHALASSLFKLSQQYFGARFGFGVPEMRIVSNLDVEGPQSATQLVALTAMDKALVSRLLTALRARGAIEPVPGCSERRAVWRLSKEGRDLVTKLRPLWLRREGRVQAVLTDAEQILLKDMLTRLFESSEKLRMEETRSLRAEKQESGSFLKKRTKKLLTADAQGETHG